MTISALGVTAVYFGIGGTGPFPLQDDAADPILFENDDEIIVKSFSDPRGEYTAGTLLTLNVDYTLSGAGSMTPGSVTLTAPLALGYLLVIRRVTARTQTLDLVYGGDLSLENLEATMDKAIRLIQELKEQTERAMLFSATETALVSSRSRIMPAPAVDSALIWNSDDQLENRDIALLGGTGLPGPTGATGPMGVQGVRGKIGPFGPTGGQGDQGERGSTGRRGPTGARGRLGFPGREGDEGDQGDRGPVGRRGLTGSIGVTGVRGPRGYLGREGDQGDDGQPGYQGRRGPTGATGSTGPSPAGKHTVPVPAVSMYPRTTNGAAAGTVELATNKVMLRTFDFDATTQEFVQFRIAMPKSWDEGTVTFQALWSHAATATNFGVAWSLAAVAVSDDDAQDAAFGTAVQVTDTGGTTNDVYITSESSTVTIAGTPAELDDVIFQVARVPADAADTMAIDARLQGIRLFMTTNAATDA